MSRGGRGAACAGSGFDWRQTIRELSDLSALSGHEEPVIAYMKERLAPHADKLEVDPLGNVICHIRGRNPEQGRPAMIFAHMDELGLMVRKIEPNGYIRFVRVGGVVERVLQGQRVVFTGDNGLVYGTIGVKAHHVTPAEDKYKVVPFDQCYIDIGASSAAEAEERGVRVGTPITYAPSFADVGDFVSGKALDNRVGCAMLLALAERFAAERPAIDVALVATVQEEFNIRGAVPAAYALNPAFAVCLDIAVAHDTPDLADRANLELGGGPVIGYYSFHGRGTLGGLIPNPKLCKGFEAVARAAGIPFQRNVFFGGLGDSSFLQLVREGIPAVDIGFACRYTHTPVETVSLSDCAAAADWVAAYVLSLERLPDLSRG